MPRQDVPYGGAICRLRERIAEIWDKLGEKLHSINGVEGDAAGNVEILSGDSAVVISNDQVNHQITIGLDQAELPSAAVTSVNGQTGAVVLDANDIASDGNSDVQTDIDNLKTNVNANTSAIASEALARANADSALQTNINTISASIPEMSTTPDPYKGVERDAQGRAFGADPASGAVDQSLVTANWASQTGDSSPNNLIHKTGNETKDGVLFLIQPPSVISPKTARFRAANGYFRIARFTLNPRYYTVAIMANTGTINSLSIISGQYNNGVWTCTNSTIATPGTPSVLKIGVGTVNNQPSLIAHVSGNSTATILITGSNVGFTGEPDGLRMTTNESITMPADYIEGGFIA